MRRCKICTTLSLDEIRATISIYARLHAAISRDQYILELKLDMKALMST